MRVTGFSRKPPRAPLREEDEAALERYITRPVETSVVIFIADDLDKRRKFSKTLLEVCTSVEFAALTDSELATWARDRLKHLSANADERTLRQIIALTGASVRQLATELEKLATAALPGGHVTMEMVDALVGRSRELSNFELTDRLIARDRRRALETLSKLLDDGAEPVMLIGLLASSFHRLALAKDLMSKGAPNNEVYRQVGIFGRREEFLATARRSDASQLARSIERIAQADLAIKTSLSGGGAQGSRLQLDLLICELAA